MLPSVVSLIQGIGGDDVCILVNITTSGEEIFEKRNLPPHFSPMEYFIFIFVTFLCSVIAFTLLDRLKLAKREYAAGQIDFGNNYKYEENNTTTAIDTVANDASEKQDKSTKISSTEYAVLLLLIGCLSFFANGMFNSIQSYSSLPYGNSAYHLSVTLSVIANPVACFLAIFLPHTSLRPIYVLCCVCGTLTAYVFITACMSPLPPLHGTTAGSTIVVCYICILYTFINCFFNNDFFPLIDYYMDPAGWFSKLYQVVDFVGNACTGRSVTSMDWWSNSNWCFIRFGPDIYFNKLY